MSELDRLQQRIKTWADARMPDRDIPGRLRKLGEEHGEFGEAITHYLVDRTSANAVKAGIEAADMVLVLADTLEMMGLSLYTCLDTKMKIIEQRPVEGFQEFK